MYIGAEKVGYKIMVSERNTDGVRRIKEYDTPYVCYYQDDTGKYKSIYGDKLRKFRVTNRKKFYEKLEILKANKVPIFESDVPVVFRLLEEQYPTNDFPDLHVTIFDLEWDRDPKKGWAGSNNPYAPITANTIYNKWEDRYYTLVVPPPGMDHDDARDLLDGTKHQDVSGKIHTTGRIPLSDIDEFGELTEDRDYFICEDEAELLQLSLSLFEDSDVLTGWNSETADIPYLISRIRIVLGGEDIEDLISETQENRQYQPSPESVTYLEYLNLFPTVPKLDYVEKFGNFEKVYKLTGRVHLDYMELYKKFTFDPLHSYRLDYVLQVDIGQKKVEYNGSLDQLYRNDLRRFTAYSRQDVAGLAALDKKRKMVDLANNMAHMAGVTLDKVMGSVSIIEQAILKRLHQTGRICFDKKPVGEKESVPGAFVVPSRGGIFRHGMSYDFNSLYPTVIRMLNISPEMIVGQFDLSRTEMKFQQFVMAGMKDSEAWAKFTGTIEYHMIMDGTNDELTFVVEDTGEEIVAPANQWKKVLRENNWSLSANGTVFDLSREGIVAQCLTEWYAQRVEAKDMASEYFTKAKEAKEAGDEEEYNRLNDLYIYYDMEQMVKKIFLNSTYGAYLNAHFRFFDIRLGKSVTLSGRVMTKEMVRYMENTLDVS